MKVFLTGASGFIGRELVPRLIAKGHTATLLTRQSSPPARDGVSYVTGDLLDRGALRAGMAGSDCVVHLAGAFSWWLPEPSVFTRVNVDGTRAVMESALEAAVPKVVHVSSVVVYGTPERQPFVEETPVGPERHSEYARTKYAGDLIAWDLHHDKGLPLVVVYPANVVGPGDAHFSGVYVRDVLAGRVPAVMAARHPMTHVHVRDVAAALAATVETPGNVGQRYIVGKEQLTSVDLHRRICALAGARGPLFEVPDPITLVIAAAATRVANLTKRPPPLGLCTDLARTVIAGIRADGSKAERELGVCYTPVQVALEEQVSEILRTRNH